MTEELARDEAHDGDWAGAGAPPGSGHAGRGPHGDRSRTPKDAQFLSHTGAGPVTICCAHSAECSHGWDPRSSGPTVSLASPFPTLWLNDGVSPAA